jgi:hypothetical protein
LVDEKIAAVLARRREIEETTQQEALRRMETMMSRQSSEWATKDSDDGAYANLVSIE